MGEIRVIGDEAEVDVIDPMDRRSVEGEEAHREGAGALAGLLADGAGGTGADSVGQLWVGYCLVRYLDRVQIQKSLCVTLPGGGGAGVVDRCARFAVSGSSSTLPFWASQGIEISLTDHNERLEKLC